MIFLVPFFYLSLLVLLLSSLIHPRVPVRPLRRFAAQAPEGRGWQTRAHKRMSRRYVTT